MNPREALSLGSISQIVMPSELRRVADREHGILTCATTRPVALQSVQREFH
jgi:hypothetical protein